MKRITIYILLFFLVLPVVAQRTTEYKNMKIEVRKDYQNKDYYILGDSTWFFDRTFVEYVEGGIECFLEPQIIYQCPRGSEIYELYFNVYIASTKLSIPDDPKVYFKMEDDEIIQTVARGGGLGFSWNDLNGQKVSLRFNPFLVGQDMVECFSKKFIKKIRIEAQPHFIEWYFDNETAADFFNTITEYIELFKEYKRIPKKDAMLEGF